MITKALFKKIFTYVKPKYLLKSKIRYCNCCERKTLFLQLNERDEFNLCLRCRANKRYAMLAEYIDNLGDLSTKTIVELDDRSPLYQKLKKYPLYTRTFFSTEVPFGTVLSNGTRCEDIQQLTFEDNSIDLMISSDVLEHVVNIDLAFAEMKRVLTPGGKHIFTIPTYDGPTRQRATITDNEVKHFLPAEYHCDPAKDGDGFILVFWDYGPDLADRYTDETFKVSILRGVPGVDEKIVWCAEKL